MSERNYDASSRMVGGFPKIQKLGAVGRSGESSPFSLVRDGEEHLMRLELSDPNWGADPQGYAVALIRDCETGEILSRFGEGCYYYSMYIEDGTYYVLGTVRSPQGFAGEEIRLFQSQDLVNWQSRSLLRRPGWLYYNTSLTKGPQGYMLLLEASHPREAVGEHPFTLFFASSPDMVHWSFLPDEQGFSKQRYMGGPFMKYADGWYYVISVTALPCERYTNYIYRTRDFIDWQVGYYNPILMPSAEDKLISPTAFDVTPELKRQIATAFISSNADIDLCAYKGKTVISYNVGNQLGFYYMAEARYDGTPEEFLKAYFE